MLLDSAATNSALPKLDAELVVEDSSGDVVVAHDEMTVIVRDSKSANADLSSDDIERQVDTYLLPDTASSETDRSIERIADSIADGATITITPKATGGADRAMLAERLNYVAGQLRTLCDARGRHIAALRISDREATSNLAAEQSGPMVEIAVAQDYRER
jgi:hypothetical protein